MLRRNLDLWGSENKYCTVLKIRLIGLTGLRHLHCWSMNICHERSSLENLKSKCHISHGCIERCNERGKGPTKRCLWPFRYIQLHTWKHQSRMSHLIYGIITVHYSYNYSVDIAGQSGLYERKKHYKKHLLATIRRVDTKIATHNSSPSAVLTLSIGPWRSCLRADFQTGNLCRDYRYAVQRAAKNRSRDWYLHIDNLDLLKLRTSPNIQERGRSIKSVNASVHWMRAYQR